MKYISLEGCTMVAHYMSFVGVVNGHDIDRSSSTSTSCSETRPCSSKQKQGHQQLIQLNSAAAAIAALAAGPATTATIAAAANFSCMKLAAGLAATPCGTVSTLHWAANT